MADVNRGEPPALITEEAIRRRVGELGRRISEEYAQLGFEIPDVWVVGYGLEDRERYRALPYIGILPAES